MQESPSSLFSGKLRARPLDLSGIENALLDLLVQADDSVVEELGLVKGTMRLVETDEQQRILDRVGSLDPEIEAGGSCANVLRAVARLGATASYSSAVADDPAGDAFIDGLRRNQVTDRCARLNSGATGTSVILVTPDGERTMNTHLGVCRQYAPEHVPHDDIAHSRMFFTTAYIWDTPNQIAAIEAALETARGAGCRLAMDLADPFAVGRSEDQIRRQVARGFDVIFANAEEARILTKKGVRGAAHEIASTVRIAVVTDGASGAWIVSQDQEIHVPAQRVQVVDTTGAGDLFAAGFLFGLLRELPLLTCGEIATALAADTITQMGVKLSEAAAQRAREIAGVPARR